MTIRCLSLFLLGMMSGSIMQLEAKKYRHMRQDDAPTCTDEAGCLAPDGACHCYCSGIGGFRNKNETDKPIFIPKDVNGKYCYCKQWDYDNFPFAKRPADQNMAANQGDQKSASAQEPRKRRRQ